MAFSTLRSKERDNIKYLQYPYGRQVKNMLKILVPGYATSSYERPLEKAVELAKSADAEVHLLYVFDRSMTARPFLVSLQSKIDKRAVTKRTVEHMAEKLFSEAAEKMGDDKKIHTKCVSGTPVSEILEYAVANKIDIIMVQWDKIGREVVEKAPKDMAVYQVKGEEILKEVNIVSRDDLRRHAQVSVLNAKYNIGEEILFLPLVAVEDVSFKSGDIKSIKIDPILVPPSYHMVQCPYARHGVGFPIAVCGPQLQKIEDGRDVDCVIFAAVQDGDVQKNDLIGTLPASPITEFLP